MKVIAPTILAWVVLAFGCQEGITQGSPAAAPAAPSADYLIGPGDQLRVFVLGSPELAADVPVRPDGKISTPLVPELIAVGKTPAQLSADLAAALSTYVRSPNVSVIVTGAKSSFSQVKVIGQAVSPKAVPFRSGMTALDVMIEVGGLTQYAAGNRAKIVRTVNGKTIELRLRLADIMNKGAVAKNVEMMPGDVLVIPESRF